MRERAADDRSPYAETLADLFAATPRLASFRDAMTAAGLRDLLTSPGPYTVFAPTDLAFSKLTPERFASLLADTNRLSAILQHHVVPGLVKAPALRKPRNATPISGDSLHLTRTEDGFYVDDARIVRTNIRGTNGVIHAIDTVLEPR